MLQRLLAALLLLAAFAGACSPADELPARETGAPGITDTQVLLGSSLALKGHASYLGSQTLTGALAYINHVNDHGGVHGRRIRVIAYDDSYDPPQCLVNTQRLIVEDQVFALFCYVGTPTTVKILPFIEDARIPLLGMFTGANALREPFNRYIINVRASYYQETGAAVQHMVEDLRIEKIAVFYQYDAYGFDGLTGTELALKRYGLEPVARGFYVRGTLNVEEGLARIEKSGAQAVVMIGTYDPCAKFIRLAREHDFHPIFYNVSFVGAEELARRLGRASDEIVLMSQVVPPPYGEAADALKGSSVDYLEHLAQYYPDETPNVVGLEGYLNARVLVEGLERAGRDLTRARFISAIESIRDLPIGGGGSIKFSPSDHQGLERVYFTRLEADRFELIKDWKGIGTEHSSRPPAAGPVEARP